MPVDAVSRDAGLQSLQLLELGRAQLVVGAREPLVRVGREEMGARDELARRVELEAEPGGVADLDEAAVRDGLVE